MTGLSRSHPAQVGLVGRRLALGDPRPERMARQVDGRGFVDEGRRGDDVSVHWSRA